MRRFRLWLRDPYLLNAFITTGIFIIAAMSLNLLLGYTGQLSLGHVAFFGIGAYTQRADIARLRCRIVRRLPRGARALAGHGSASSLAIVVAGLCGYLVGRLSFRVRGAYFVIVTISFAEVVRLVALNWVELTQGPLALTNIPPFTLGLPGLGYLDALRQARKLLSRARRRRRSPTSSSQRIVHSRVGRAMVALKENESLAVSVGIDVTRYLVLAAVISAAIAGAAGSLYAHYLRIIDPDIFLFLYTVTMVIMVITGGKGTLAGPVVGGADLRLHSGDRCGPFAAPEVQWILYGVLMIVDRLRVAAGHRAGAERWFALGPRRRRSASPRQCEAASAQVTAMTRAPALAIEHVAVHFGGLVAIADMNFVVNEGEICQPDRPERRRQDHGLQRHHRLPAADARARCAIAARSLNGLKPHEVAGARPGRARSSAPACSRAHTVFDNVLIGLHLRGRSSVCRTRCSRLPRRARVRARAARAAARTSSRLVGIERRAHELAGSLPYGDQRLLGVALALAAEPSMLLLDEPVSGMNAVRDRTLHAAARASIREPRHHHPAGRARHADGDGRLRPHRRAELRPHHRRGPARGDPRRSGGDPRLSRASAASARVARMLEVRDLVCRYGEVAALQGRVAEVAQGPARGADRRERRRQEHDAARHLGPAAGQPGRIVFEGEDITQRRRRRSCARGIAHCPEGRRVFPHMSVDENLDMGAYLRARRGGDRGRPGPDLRAVSAVSPSAASRSAGTLSGGEQQMLAIGRALDVAARSSILFDEPSLGLAPNIVERVFEIIAGIRDAGTTVLMVEQNAYAALEMCDYAYLLESGVIATSGKGADLIDNPHVQRGLPRRLKRRRGAAVLPASGKINHERL